MKILSIRWLGSCENCGSAKPHSVTTKLGTTAMLFDGDKVECKNCGHKGAIECCDGCAYVVWDEVTE